jgi:Carboxypeptidase regulatory-like domain
MTRAPKFSLMALLLLPVASTPLATQLDTGSIDGVIMDEAGPVANATVEARNVVSGAVFPTESDALGYYKVENLRSGRYSLWVQAGRDSLWIPPIPVEPGEAVHQDLHLTRSHRGASGL